MEASAIALIYGRNVRSSRNCPANVPSVAQSASPIAAIATTSAAVMTMLCRCADDKRNNDSHCRRCALPDRIDRPSNTQATTAPASTRAR